MSIQVGYLSCDEMPIGDYAKLEADRDTLKKRLEKCEFELGQALRVARYYKARLERCEALAREGK